MALTQEGVKFSDFVRSLPAASEADLSAGNNMPIVSASAIKKMGGENVAKAGYVNEKIGFASPYFERGGIYFNTDAPWSKFSTQSRVRTSIDSLVKAHDGAKIKLADYTNLQLFVGYKNTDGVTKNSGWISSGEYVFGEDCVWAATIKKVVDGVETAITDEELLSVCKALYFEDTGIVNENLLKKTRNVISLVGSLRQGRLNSSTGKWEYDAKDAVSTYEGIYFRANPNALKIKFNFVNAVGKQLRVRVAWWKKDGSSNGTTGSYADASKDVIIKANSEYFSLSFIVWDVAANKSTTPICPVDVDAFGISFEGQVADKTIMDCHKSLDNIERPYRYSGAKIQLNKWQMANRYNVPLIASVGAGCQSMSILGNKLVVICRSNTSNAKRGGIFSLDTQSLIATFELPHAGLNDPHANMCSARMDGNDIILYIDQWDGEKLCLVYRLSASANYAATLIQTIGSNSSNQGAGYRDWAVDFFNNKIYSIGYKQTTDRGDKKENTSFVTSFTLPAITAGNVTFTDDDVIDNFEVELSTCRQDCEIIGDKMLMGYGLGSSTETGICILNLVNHEVESDVRFNVVTSAIGEPEGVCTNDDGNIYFMYAGDNNVKRLFV